MKTISFLLAVIILAASCASSTMIKTVPPGAEVYINSELKGVSPYKLTDSKIIMAKTYISLKAEGYTDFQTILVKDEAANIGAIVGGVLLFWPLLLWSTEYNPEHRIIGYETL